MDAVPPTCAAVPVKAGETGFRASETCKCGCRWRFVSTHQLTQQCSVVPLWKYGLCQPYIHKKIKFGRVFLASGDAMLFGLHPILLKKKPWREVHLRTRGSRSEFSTHVDSDENRHKIQTHLVVRGKRIKKMNALIVA